VAVAGVDAGCAGVSDFVFDGPTRFAARNALTTPVSRPGVVATIVLEEADQRAENANVLACGGIVVSDGQELSAECINALREAGDEHSD